MESGVVLMRYLPLLLMLAIAPAAVADEVKAPGRANEAKVRRFDLEYACTLKALPARSKVQVWLPVPSSSDQQQIEILRQNLPGAAELRTESKHGNRMLYLAWTATGEAAVPMSVAYRVERREVRGPVVPNPMKGVPLHLTASQREKLLQPDARVPNEGRPLTLIAGLELSKDPLTLGRQLYDRVDDHMRYDKTGTGWGRGDAVWACDSRYGNCTDFHSLFMSLARSRGLPAMFDIGFSIPNERGEGVIAGYHCWAWFFAEGHGWVPVDISEADKHPEMKEYYYGNLTADRVAFSTGRDLQLSPPQQGAPLNFFVYPYVEVDGKPLAAEQVELKLRYRDRE
jgi:transglutaminase-like putative cysteine protease